MELWRQSRARKEGDRGVWAATACRPEILFRLRLRQEVDPRPYAILLGIRLRKIDEMLSNFRTPFMALAMVALLAAGGCSSSKSRNAAVGSPDKLYEMAKRASDNSNYK